MQSGFPLYPQKQTSAVQLGMSAMGQTRIEYQNQSVAPPLQCAVEFSDTFHWIMLREPTGRRGAQSS
jgi:hypothetical protein